MRIDIRDQHRNFLGSARIDDGKKPHQVMVNSSNGEEARPLNWENATDEQGAITKCIACGCREVFARKDFPQLLGLSLVIIAGLVSIIFFAYDRVLISMGVLASAVILDSLIYYFTPRCVVCYRCRTEYHEAPVSPSVEPWDLSIGEKYRPIREYLSEGELTNQPESAGEPKVNS